MFSKESKPFLALSKDIFSNLIEPSIPTIPASEIDEYSERLNGSFGLGELEPRESVKGDIARAVFYFYTMYREEADPDFFIDMLPTLIDWHHQNPTSIEELTATNYKARYQEDKADEIRITNLEDDLIQTINDPYMNYIKVMGTCLELMLLASTKRGLESIL